MSVDSKWVPKAQLIPLLSYEEAAELAYFGAKILHPRTMEPVREAQIEIAIKNTLNPDAAGTLIRVKSPKTQAMIKSVAHNAEIGVMKIHASGVGARPGILGRIADCLAEHGLNIKSAITSQTCISMLLDAKDLEAGQRILKGMKPRPSAPPGPRSIFSCVNRICTKLSGRSIKAFFLKMNWWAIGECPSGAKSQFIHGY